MLTSWLVLSALGLLHCSLVMSGSCCFGFAGLFCLFSLTCLAIAAGTSFWYVVKPIDEPNEASNSTEGAYLYPYHAGIFMTCYTRNIPDTVKESDLINGHCVMNYDFPSNKIEEFARTSTVTIVLSCAMTFCAGIVGLAGCVCRKKTPLLLGSLVLYISCIVTLIGMCTYIARILLEQEARDIPLPGNVTAEFGWSFYLGWGALALQLLASSVLIGGAKGCGSSAKDNGEFM